MNYVPIKDLKFGYADASQYMNSPEQELFHRFYLIHPQAEKLINSPCYFLVGEKGTGKTSFATYYMNWPTKDVVGYRLFVEKDDYSGFRRFLDSSESQSVDYTEIWRTILAVVLFFHVRNSQMAGEELVGEAKNISNVIDSISMGSFDGSVSSALDLFAWNPASLIQALGGKPASSAPLRTLLRYIQARVFDAMKGFANQSRTVLLFIDGIDTRPFVDDSRTKRLSYSDYLACVRGLVSATWHVNNAYLRPIFGHKVRPVLLIRPDIIDRVGLQNLNTVMLDNSLLLNWYSATDYRKSQLFALADNILYQQQICGDGQYVLGKTWDHYFPYDAIGRDEKPIGSFVAFRRNTLHRPRDLVTLLEFVVDSERKSGNGNKTSIPISATWSKDVRTEYSRYLLGEVKETLSFYHETEEFDLFLRFFQYLSDKNAGGHKFTYRQYVDAYADYREFINKNVQDPKDIFSTADVFLQFLFELNIISYKSQGHDGRVIWNTCIHERSYANIRPKVRTHAEYQLHYGMARALHSVRIG